LITPCIANRQALSKHYTDEVKNKPVLKLNNETSFHISCVYLTSTKQVPGFTTTDSPTGQY
jgi:hypothetical protein